MPLVNTFYMILIMLASVVLAIIASSNNGIMKRPGLVILSMIPIVSSIVVFIIWPSHTVPYVVSRTNYAVIDTLGSKIFIEKHPQTNAIIVTDISYNPKQPLFKADTAYGIMYVMLVSSVGLETNLEHKLLSKREYDSLNASGVREF